MRLFDERRPWIESEWWQAGLVDARNCVRARYGGSDDAEDEIRAYIHGYMEGERVNARTTPCPRTEESKPFVWVECSTFYPGLLSERWRVMTDVVLWMVLIVLALTVCLIVATFALKTMPG